MPPLILDPQPPPDREQENRYEVTHASPSILAHVLKSRLRTDITPAGLIPQSFNKEPSPSYCMNVLMNPAGAALIDMKSVVTTAGSEYVAKTTPPATRGAECLAIGR
jgi:hypothetical protein